MKFVTTTDSFGILDSSGNRIIDLNDVSMGTIPNNMYDFLADFNKNIKKTKTILNNLDLDEIEYKSILNILSPLNKVNSFRDAYAFRQHVEAGRRNRGLEMIPEYDEFPVFYFSNPNSIIGPGDVVLEKEYFKKLDFELEIAVIVSKKGKNISKSEALNYIAGFTIMNDWSERHIQMKEMKLNLGPAKGKDFATSIGPYLVTPNELDDVKIESDDGERYNLKMKAYINDSLVSEDNFKNMTWTFAQIIERASFGTELYPGDIIGSGTCATGCFLELNQGNNNPKWLKEGDTVRLEIDRLGSLSNKICLVG